MAAAGNDVVAAEGIQAQPQKIRRAGVTAA
jgi:hypothetical protein